ncbi:LytR C-terminal domain-containing protein [Arthrobacter sp. ZGTC131]|uniref:LytR C-terminal domain-containing protein n=1 Tax=Arthrobacter sp. ZGTC131 TaxID=2058898 RepID=UPI000CE49C4D|nr:LytR C-terminal domain-containing protein [Arthrobacter sp. ZGTC131]
MARKPKDVTVLHGHRVITGPELRATFEEPDDTPDDPGRLRRRILHGVVLVLLFGLIVAGILGAVGVMNGQIKFPTAIQTQDTADLCPDATFNYTPNAKVKVNVFNSTSRAGLAKSAANEFRARKFVVGAVGNTESGYRGVAAVVSGAAGQAAAFSVQRNVPGSDYFQDGRSDASVDVILTGDYRGLIKPALVDQTPGKLSCPRESRRVADDSAPPVIPTGSAKP